MSKVNEKLEEFSRRRIDQIDNLFLFSVSLIGLLFALIQNLLGEFELVYFFSLIIIGIVVPIYIGYFHGALQDKMENRRRGWIYFIFGTSSYITFTILSILALKTSLSARNTINILFLLLIAFAVYIPFYYLGIRFLNLLTERYFNFTVKEDWKVILHSQTSSILFIAVIFSLYFWYLYLRVFYITENVLIALITLPFVGLSVIILCFAGKNLPLE